MVRLLRARALRGAAHGLDRGQACSSTSPLDRTVTVTASPSKGLEATLDLAERLTGHGYVAVPHLAARMVRDRAELAEICDRLTGKGITRVFVPGGDADPPGGYPDALSMLEDLADARPAVRARRHHRLPRVAPDHQRRPHHPVDVGQAPLRHPRGQQPDLRPRRADHLGAPDARAAASPCRCCSASPARSTAPSCSRWPPRSASASRPGSWSSTRAPSPGWPRPVASPARSSCEKCAPALSPPEMLVEGLHVFTFNQVAETEQWRRDLLEQLDRQGLTAAIAVTWPRSVDATGCSAPTELRHGLRRRRSQSSSSAASSRPSPVSTTVSGSPIRSAACSASARSSASGSWASHTTRV